MASVQVGAKATARMKKEKEALFALSVVLVTDDVVPTWRPWLNVLQRVPAAKAAPDAKPPVGR